MKGRGPWIFLAAGVFAYVSSQVWALPEYCEGRTEARETYPKCARADGCHGDETAHCPYEPAPPRAAGTKPLPLRPAYDGYGAAPDAHPDWHPLPLYDDSHLYHGGEPGPR